MSKLSFNIEHNYLLHDEDRVTTDYSVIYRAQDLVLRKDVCIKEVRIAGQMRDEIQQNLNNAILEARKMVQVSERSKAVPAVHLTYFDKESKKFYIVMDWIAGDTLDRFIGNGSTRANEWQFLTWMEDLCEVLITMSREKIYHKDIKPANLIIDRRERLHLLDFSISASLPNKVEGTPFYKAPEMENASTVKRDKVDIFSIGVMMYQYYTGKIPRYGSEYGQRSLRHRNTDWDVFVYPNEINPDVSERVNGIIANCMQKNPDKRMDIWTLKKQIRMAKDDNRRNGKKN